MNILVVNWLDNANPHAGGAEVHVHEIFRRLVAHGDRVTLVSSGFPGATREDTQDGIRVVRTGTRETYNITAPRLIRTMTRETHYDLVVDDINKIPLFTPLYVRTPVLAMVPHLFGASIYREANPLVATYVYLMEKPIRYVYRHTHFEVISRSTADDLVARGIPRERIHIVHCGIDHATYTPHPTDEKFACPTLLFVGRVRKYKGIDILLRALPLIKENVPELQCIIVGAGEYLAATQTHIAREGLADYVRCTGFISHDEKIDLLRRSHLIVNPSAKEGWGLTNIEANACGTIALASDVDGLRDAVKHDLSGRLFPYGDHVALAREASELLRDTALRTRMEQTALTWAAQFQWDTAARETRELCAKIAASR